MSFLFKRSGRSRSGKRNKKSSCSKSTTGNTESFLRELNSSGGSKTSISKQMMVPTSAAIDFISNMSSETIDCMSNTNPEAIDNSMDEVVVERDSLNLIQESTPHSRKDHVDLTEDDVSSSQVIHEQQQMIAKLKAQLAEEQAQFDKAKQDLVESHIAELKRRGKERVETELNLFQGPSMKPPEQEFASKEFGQPVGPHLKASTGENLILSQSLMSKDRDASTDSSKCVDSKSDAISDKFTAARELATSIYSLHNLLEEASKSTNAWCGEPEPQIRNSEMRASYAKVLNQAHPTQQGYVDSVLPKALELITDCNDILFEMRRNFVKSRK